MSEKTPQPKKAIPFELIQKDNAYYISRADLNLKIGPFSHIPDFFCNPDIEKYHEGLNIADEEKGQFNTWLMTTRAKLESEVLGEPVSSSETFENERSKILAFLEEKYKFYCDRFDPDLTVYVWYENSWQPIAEALILAELSKLKGANRPAINKDNLIDYFKGQGQSTEVEEKPPHLIAFKNGLFDIKANVLLPHSSKFFCTNTIPFNYVPEVTCPHWEKFLAEVHYPGDINFMQEWWGYQLYTGYGVKAFVVLMGNGDNGKTRELTVIQHVLGHKNITNVTLQNLNYGPYHCAELFHKLSNIADDIPNIKIRIAGNLKMASDGGWLNARFIYGKPFDFKNVAKITNSCNDPPEIEEDVEAIWSRLKFVEYPFTFKANPDLAKNEKQARNSEELDRELASEAEGILSWMVRGLQRLIINSFKFSYSVSQEDVRRYYKIKSNPVLFFVDACLIYTANEDADFILKKDLYPIFKQWAKKNEIKNIPSSTKFFRVLKDTGIEAVQSRDFDMERIYKGYKCQAGPLITQFLSRIRTLSGMEEVEMDGALFTQECKTYSITLAALMELQSAGTLRTSLLDSSLLAAAGFVKVAIKQGEKNELD